jgi:hypothetical protein
VEAAAFLSPAATGRGSQQAPGFCWQNAEPRPAPPLLEVEPLPLVPEPPVPLAPEVPEPPLALVPPEALVPPVAPLAAVPVLPAAVPPVEEVPVLPAAAALLVEDDGVVDVVLEEVVAALARLPVGTVNGGAPALFVVDEPPPPQAETPTERATPDRKMPMRRERLGTEKGG